MKIKLAQVAQVNFLPVPVQIIALQEFNLLAQVAQVISYYAQGKKRNNMKISMILKHLHTYIYFFFTCATCASRLSILKTTIYSGTGVAQVKFHLCQEKM